MTQLRGPIVAFTHRWSGLGLPAESHPFVLSPLLACWREFSPVSATSASTEQRLFDQRPRALGSVTLTSRGEAVRAEGAGDLLAGAVDDVAGAFGEEGVGDGDAEGFGVGAEFSGLEGSVAVGGVDGGVQVDGAVGLGGGVAGDG